MDIGGENDKKNPPIFLHTTILAKLIHRTSRRNVRLLEASSIFFLIGKVGVMAGGQADAAVCGWRKQGFP